jgi:endonuclease/exonuclease/phosphatase family metal-dependent hydrolase
LLEPWHPYGKVESGLGTYSRFQPTLAERVQLPGQQPMPKRLFELDRCLAVHRFPTAKGPELVLVNVHNSAYDRGDKIKSRQMAFVRDFAAAEFDKGNYVVLGGDWNQCPPNVQFDMFTPGFNPGYTISSMPIDFFPENWRYAYDPTTPTNRSAKDPYISGKTFLTLIDYFLVSPNVQIISVKGMAQEFSWSDHQPVHMTFRLQ